MADKESRYKATPNYAYGSDKPRMEILKDNVSMGKPTFDMESAADEKTRKKAEDYASELQRETKGKKAGSFATKGYRVVVINKKTYKEHRLVWLYHYGHMPKDQIDHINRIRDDNRIENLEYYTSLTALEKQAADFVVLDANNLDRFKNGIFVDNFTSFLSSCVANPEYSVAIDEQSGVARPKFILDTFRVNFSNTTSTNSQQTGRAITLPYTTIKFISQPYATEYMSASPVQFHWNGNMRLAPSYDNNICQTSTASVNITQCNVQPWKQFANTPFGSVWGSWNTTTNTNKTTVQVGTVCTTYIVVIPPIIPTNGCNGSEG